ncbi:hypothetical protein DES53_12036 [Roseimicrobium gellanilyticum]|uniref:DUF3987 domain-containing protein n=1 Tax=Roseimicrobium gellanilyticum TaxID=748857 RepID=A0A366H1M2_9BACT|nr:hypothetical protein [Roseimicrobium gellanilyticum]RBP35668.1 hypothetical protein DES53_12036 [Roseimicrobium gellanilyticum]
MSQAPDCSNKTQLRPWIETFGNHLCGMSCTLGLPVEEVALCVAGVLANVTGPLSGLVTKGGAGISQGVNLISVGELSHRSQRLAEHLFRPLHSLQDFMRHAAHRTSRVWGDMYLSGPESLKTWREALAVRPTEIHTRLVQMLEATVNDLNAGDTLPMGWDSPVDPMPSHDGKHTEMLLRERVPGVRHLPSFVLRPGSLNELPGMMADVVEQHAFVLDPEGRLFEQNDADGAKWGSHARYLSQLMGGKDVPMPRLHQDQGNGKLVRGRIALFSSLSPERVAEILGEAGAGTEKPVLEEAILWAPSECKVRPLQSGGTQAVWGTYKGILERLVNDRAARKGTIVQHSPHLMHQLEELDAEMVRLLDATPPELRRYMRPFAALVQKLSWAFTVLGIDEGRLSKAVQATTAYAVERHVALLKAAFAQVQVQRAARFARQIQSILKAKGPCNARTLQRSIFQSRRSDIDAGLERLMSAGQVVYLQTKREYHIPDDGDLTNHRLTQPLNSTING